MKNRMTVGRGCCDAVVNPPVTEGSNTTTSFAIANAGKRVNLTGDENGQTEFPFYNRSNNTEGSFAEYFQRDYDVAGGIGLERRYTLTRNLGMIIWSSGGTGQPFDVPSYTKVTLKFTGTYPGAAQTQQQQTDYTFYGLLGLGNGLTNFSDTDFTTASVVVNTAAEDWTTNPVRTIDITAIVDEIYAQPGFDHPTHTVSILMASDGAFQTLGDPTVVPYIATRSFLGAPDTRIAFDP